MFIQIAPVGFFYDPNYMDLEHYENENRDTRSEYS